MRSAYYQQSVRDFIEDDSDAILGQLSRAHGFDLVPAQRDAWFAQIEILKQALAQSVNGHVLFEFAIPRMGKRADVLVYFSGIVVVLEFKVGSTTYDRSAIEQVHDYALDLKNFHLGSHQLCIVPVLVATAAAPSTVSLRWDADKVARPIAIAPKQLADVLSHALELSDLAAPPYLQWLNSGYQPTPTIVEAAQALYQQHNVMEIARSDAGARNLGATADCISEVIDHAKAQGRKAICLITGVPGAGKTLAGLNVATRRAQDHSDEHAVFLSGNGPLVAVLREALARDEQSREGTSKKDALRKVSSFVQNIHHFRDESLRNPKPPHEHVVVFDEAQRAWTRDQAAKFMKNKKRISDFDMSEPEFLIDVMARREDWCVVICLIGGGQEINTGEAGLSEWIAALGRRSESWDVYISNRLADRDYVSDDATAAALTALNAQTREELHLAVSMRSFRSEAVSAFVGHVVDNQPDQAHTLFSEIKERYPILLTRDLGDARDWMRQQARGSERTGLLASSGGHRLRPEGLHVKAKIDPPTWFLNDRTDVRSSFYFEEVATEFDVQGLEIDWAAVCWDADFRYQAGAWSHRKFRGTIWQKVADPDAQTYLRNAYRVLLTRARQGMIIFVPTGLDSDSTRPKHYYDQTFQFLQTCGLPVWTPPKTVDR